MTTEEFTGLYDLTLGMYIRNCFRLKNKDSRIIEKLGGVDAEEASTIIWRDYGINSGMNAQNNRMDKI